MQVLLINIFYYRKVIKMIKKFMKNLIAFAVVLLIALPMFSFTLTANGATAEELDKQLWGPGGSAKIQEKTGLGGQDPRIMAATIINVVMGFLGIVAVVIVLIGGFKWMIAGGGEDKVGEAKKMITEGVIGLIIVVMAFAIAKFAVNALMSATTTT